MEIYVRVLVSMYYHPSDVAQHNIVPELVNIFYIEPITYENLFYFEKISTDPIQLNRYTRLIPLEAQVFFSLSIPIM